MHCCPLIFYEIQSNYNYLWLFVCFLRVRQFGGGLLNSSQTQMTGQLTPEEGESE